MGETILIKKCFTGETILVKKCFVGETILAKKCFPIYVIDAVNGTQYHKNTKRFATKTPNDLPQKHQTAYVIPKKSVILDKISCAQK